MKYDNQFRYALEIIKDYDGRAPLSAWLRDFYKENKQMGSRDRKNLSEMVFCYFRLGHQQFETVEKRLLAAISISSLTPIKEYFKIDEKKEGNIDQIFPFTTHLSEGIDHQKYAYSFLIQPDLFLRLRPGKRELVTAKLSAAAIPFTEMDENCIALANTTRVENILEINSEVVVQDRSSQQTGNLFPAFTEKPDVWDCCAASGGKSIMAVDMIKNISLTVSDKRKSILDHLRKRFLAAGIREYEYFVSDLTREKTERKFDLVIADVPCSGSGTWARTPEQLYFFKEERINYYSQLQHAIVTNASASLKPDGFLLYITCSVFREENEDVVDYISNELKLKIVKQEMFKGYEQKADTLFAALFTN